MYFFVVFNFRQVGEIMFKEMSERELLNNYTEMCIIDCINTSYMEICQNEKER